jgi:hypothetical protein
MLKNAGDHLRRCYDGEEMFARALLAFQLPSSNTAARLPSSSSSSSSSRYGTRSISHQRTRVSSPAAALFLCTTLNRSQPTSRAPSLSLRLQASIATPTDEGLRRGARRGVVPQPRTRELLQACLEEQLLPRDILPHPALFGWRRCMHARRGVSRARAKAHGTASAQSDKSNGKDGFF